MDAQECRGRGRPSKLDASTSAHLAALVIAGSTITDAAREVGVSRRTATGWLARAWSRDPRDADCVALVKMIVRGQIAAAEAGQLVSPPGEPAATLDPLDALLRDLA
jgi:hypothetical protein